MVVCVETREASDMWRQNISSENQESDQSISDEEDINHNPFINPRNSIQPTKIKDTVETTGLPNVESDFFQASKLVFDSISDEDKISDDEGYGAKPLFDLLGKGNNMLSSNSAQVSKSDICEFESREEDGASMWSSVFEETKELMRLHENGSSSLSHSANYEVKKSWKGSSSKPKPKFSFFHSNREASLPLIAIDKKEKSTEVHQDLEGLEELEYGTKEHSMTELLEGLQKDNKKQSESDLSISGHRNIEHPMAELLERLLDNHGPLRETPKMNKETKSKRSVLTSKRTRSSLAYRALDKGDPCEPMDSTTSSDEEAAKFQLQVYDENQLKSTTPEINGHTMADRFQEALNSAAAVNDQGVLFVTTKHIGIGYYGRLQQVMQTEKERHMEFLNQSQAGIRRDEVRFIDVKILSRYLDAKLTVCHCSLGEKIKGSECAQIPQNFVDTDEKRTIIFSSRICNNVDLEVGNFVRIHPPWKEVEVTSKEAGIILCTYFSQISI